MYPEELVLLLELLPHRLVLHPKVEVDPEDVLSVLGGPGWDEQYSCFMMLEKLKTASHGAHDTTGATGANFTRN